jgi:hypothetical protein
MWKSLWNKPDDHLKGTFKYIENITNKQRAILFFNGNVFNPVIEPSKSTDIRILILALQKFNYYCSKYKIYKGEGNYKQLCNEVKTTINKNNLNEYFFIEYDPNLDIYRLNRTITPEAIDEYRKIYVDQNKYFTKYEWENIVFFFIGIIGFAKKKSKESKELRESKESKESKELRELNDQLKKLEKYKNDLENELEEDSVNEIYRENRANIDSEIDELNKKIAVIEEVIPDDEVDEKLANYGGRKNKNKKKTKRRRTKKRKTKRRKIL